MKVFLAGRASLTQIISRSQHRQTCFLPKYWYIVEMHHKKWKTSMCIYWLLTSAMPKKTKILKIDPTFIVIILRKQLVHIGLFGFSDSLSPIIKSMWTDWLLLILNCKIIFFHVCVVTKIRHHGRSHPSLRKNFISNET